MTLRCIPATTSHGEEEKKSGTGKGAGNRRGDKCKTSSRDRKNIRFAIGIGMSFVT